MQETMQEKIKQYKSRLARLHAYSHALGVMSYDRETVMPKGAVDDFADTVTLLSEDLYKMQTDPALRQLLSDLSAASDQLDPITKREVEEHLRSVARIECIPLEEYLDYQRVQSRAVSVWQEAKHNSDFASFAPYLEKLVDYTRRFALLYKPDKDPYETLLDQYEKDLTKATLDDFFDRLRAAFRPLIKKTSAARDRIDDAFLGRAYPIDAQRKLSEEIMRVMGLDRTYCVIGEVEHPFTTHFNKHDVRITTHYYEDAVASSFYSVVHEGGHALYELHTGDDLIGSPLAEGVSMGIHESQSRLYENVIGRSFGFVSRIFPTMKELFPTQLSSVTAADFWRAVNKSVPSLIRTEADELTYPFHVMIRYELEKRLIAGTLSVSDLPAEWNRLYREELGVEVPDDAHGVLQDSHWSGGAFGYFPSYAVGSAYASQFVAAMRGAFDFDAAVAAGDLAPVNRWLEEHVWRYGSLRDPARLILDACGEPFDPRFYIDYITSKINEIYGF